MEKNESGWEEMAEGKCKAWIASRGYLSPDDKISMPLSSVLIGCTVISNSNSCNLGTQMCFMKCLSPEFRLKSKKQWPSH